LEGELRAAAREFPVVVVTGPRQTGKSTLLRRTFPRHHYVALDDPLTRAAASEDPRLFLSQAERMILDEIQYAPKLLPYIKLLVDQRRHAHGRFLLTGSQYFPLMAGLSESLAGRAALYQLLGFSTEEIRPFQHSSDMSAVFRAMFNGFFPEIVAQGADRNRFYGSYLQTYLERDIRQITSVHDLKIFQNFLELLAARVGALLNLHEVANECGISFTSARRWLSLLETTRLVYLLRPYTKNISKRVIKSPKIYFTDTGLLAYLLRYPTAATLQHGPQAGAFFEAFLLGEVLKYLYNYHRNVELYFYRDATHREIDLVLDHGTFRTCIEVKATLTPRMEHVATLKTILGSWKNAQGYLASFSRETVRLAPNLQLVPWDTLDTILNKMQ
jgi:predicted AAA+ superfamily ATPase